MNQMPIVISVVGDHADYHKTALAFMERRIVPVCRVHAQQRRLFSRWVTYQISETKADLVYRKVKLPSISKVLSKMRTIPEKLTRRSSDVSTESLPDLITMSAEASEE